MTIYREKREKMRYYVMIGFYYDYDVVLSNDLRKDEQFIFVNSESPKTLFNKFRWIMLSSKLNSTFEIPFKESIFYRFKELDNVAKENQVFFVFHHNQHWLLKYKNGKYIDLLRRTYPNCIITLYLRDLISAARKLDIDFYKEKCDYVFTYDLLEAEKYNLKLCDTFYHKYDLDYEDIKYDVFFCGQAKNRLDKLIEVYDSLESRGYKCLFYVTNVAKSQQVPRDGLIYNKNISYMQNLKLMAQSRAVLEIVQHNGTGTTLRVQEALEYGKYLISNNEYLKDREFYNSNQFIIFDSSLENVDLSRIRKNGFFPQYKHLSFKEWLEELG